MRTLKLVLTYKWFDMIDDDIKKEEYRDRTPYYDKRLQGHFDTVTFYRGYSKDRREMVVECKGINPNPGRPDWGAKPGKIYNVISLGKILKRNW